MATRDWEADGNKHGFEFIFKEGDHIFFSKDGFTFKSHRSGWPPKKVSPGQCTIPSEYYKYLVRKLHGDKYDLSKTVFTAAEDLVTATCQKHGDFNIQAKYLTSTRGCPKCGDEKVGLKNRLSTDEFISKSKSVHGNKYDYSKVNYITSKTDVLIICPNHGEIYVSPGNHLSGKGCRSCGIASASAKRTMSTDEIISKFEKVHGDRYDYSLVKYNADAHAGLEIICREHGLFKQSYANHNSGQGCPSCAKEFSPRLKRGFVKSAESKKYASLYLIKCFDSSEEFYKIGITTKKLNHRFGGQSSLPYDYQMLHLYIGEPNTIWDLEKLMHRIYKNVKYIPSKEFGGRYECFSFIDQEDYIKTLNSLT